VRAWRRLLLALLLAGAAWLAAAFAAAWQLAHPERSRADPRLAREHGLQDVTLHTADGVRLAAWYARPDVEPVGTLLLTHEREGHRSARRLRGCGDSADATTGFGWHERLDVDAGLAWLQARRRDEGRDGPLVGWGRSLGAAALVYVLDPDGDADVGSDPREPPPPGPAHHAVDGLILESLYRDLETAYANRVRDSLPVPSGLARALMAPVPWAAEVVTGVEPAALRPVDVLPRLGALPLLLAGGTRDPLCTPAELDALAAAAHRARAVRLDAGHADFMEHQGWREAVAAFLAERVTE